MKTPLFVFLGVVQNGTDANLSTLKDRLEKAFQYQVEGAKFEERGELLIVTIKQPFFCFYITFVTNDYKSLSDWKEMARNSELPWDIKPVDKSRLFRIIAYLESKGWAEHRPALDLGYTILEEIERFSHCKTFTIPSLGKP